MPAVKLDENVPDSAGTILREAGHDVALARDEQLTGVPDDRLLNATTAEGRVLVTFDRGFGNVIQHPPGATPGVVVIRLGEQTLPRIRKVATILAGLLTTERVHGGAIVPPAAYRQCVRPQQPVSIATHEGKRHIAIARRKRREDPEEASLGAMSFLEHLDELRARIIRACAAVGAGMVIAVFFYDRLGNFVLEPTLRALPSGSELIFTRPSEMFAFFLNVALIGGVVLAAPFVSYQVWRFVSPGLHAREKRLVVPFVVLATIGAIAGAAFSHYVLFPSSIAFFGAFRSTHVRFMPRIEEVFDQYLKMMLAMVLVFQMPPVVFVLARVGVVTARSMWRHFKYAVLVVFILAAVLTPSPDAWNQIAFAAPMLALYVLSIGIAYAAGTSTPAQTRGDHLRLVVAATVVESARRGRRPSSWAGGLVGR